MVQRLAANLLVNSRQPSRLWRDLGAGRFFGFHLVVLGAILAALGQPLCWLSAGYILLYQPDIWSGTPIMKLLTILGGAIFLCSYLSYLALGLMCVHQLKRRPDWRAICLLPFYWIMMSYAAWRAIGQLIVCPSKWEKTPHKARDRNFWRSAARRAA